MVHCRHPAPQHPSSGSLPSRTRPSPSPSPSSASLPRGRRAMELRSPLHRVDNRHSGKPMWKPIVRTAGPPRHAVVNRACVRRNLPAPACPVRRQLLPGALLATNFSAIRSCAVSAPDISKPMRFERQIHVPRPTAPWRQAATHEAGSVPEPFTATRGLSRIEYTTNRPFDASLRPLPCSLPFSSAHALAIRSMALQLVESCREERLGTAHPR
jgi:hypothetical protein